MDSLFLRVLFVLGFSFWAFAAQASNSCPATIGPDSARIILRQDHSLNTQKQMAESNAKIQKVADFVIENEILTKEDLSKIVGEVNAFQLIGNDLSGTFLLRVVEKIRTANPRKIVAFYNQYYRTDYLEYLTSFKKLVETFTGNTPRLLRPLFGLEKYLPVQNGLIIWSKETATQYLAKSLQVLSDSKETTLHQAGEVLFQMVYISGKLTGDKLADSRELETISRKFSQLLAAGHLFIPASEGWSNSAMLAQWYSEVNVVLIPQGFGKGTIHGGLSSLETMMHDLDHVYAQRIVSLSEALTNGKSNFSKLIENSKSDFQEKYNSIIRFERYFTRLVTLTTYELKKEEREITNTKEFSDGAFLLMHEPATLMKFFNLVRQGKSKNQKEIDKLAAEVLEVLVKERQFFPDLVEASPRFQMIMGKFLNRLSANGQKHDLKKALDQTAQSLSSP